jgi:hypothetical protein
VDYEEKIIDGVLCWRGLPSGEWKQKTPQELTEMLQDLREKLTSLEDSGIIG